MNAISPFFSAKYKMILINLYCFFYVKFKYFLININKMIDF